MNDQCAPGCIEKRSRAGLKRHCIGENLAAACAILGDQPIGQVSGVRALGTLVAVLLLRWGEIAGRAGKRRAFAFAHRVNMNRMQARSKSFDINADGSSARALPKCRHADRLAILVFEFRDRLRRRPRRHRTSDHQGQTQRCEY